MMDTRLRSFPATTACVLALAAGAFAETRLANIFNDHMVLQQDKPVHVWGWAAAGTEVTVTLTEKRADAVAAVGEPALQREEEAAPATADNPRPIARIAYVHENAPAFTTTTARSQADDTGRWSVTFEPVKTSFNSKFLCVSGDTKQAILDVLVGEVWVTAGQSNMAWSGDKTGWLDKEGLLRPGIRYAHTGKAYKPQPQDELVERATWIPCEGREVGKMSTIPYLFGKYLHGRLSVPVGIINAASGGAFGHAWCSPAELAQIEFENVQRMIREDREAAEAWENPVSRKAILEDYERQYQTQLAEWEAKKAEAEAAKKRPPRKPDHKPPTGPKRPFTLGGLFNGRIHPISPLAVRGALYLQGEQQVLTWCVTRYRHIFPRIIRSFRTAFGDDELPFGIISLQGAGHNKMPISEIGAANRTAVVREIQYKAHLDTLHTGFICSHDVGRGLHPAWKRPVAERAVHWALRSVYQTIPDNSWSVDKVEFENGGAYVTIQESHTRRVRDGREWREEPAKRPVKIQTWSGNDGQYLGGFLIAGPDRRWYPAEVLPDSETKALRVWSDLVAQPIALRYGWGAFPLANIGPWENPLPPFRTDDWPTFESSNLDPEKKQQARADWYEALGQGYVDMLDRIVRQGSFDAAHSEMLIQGSATGILESKADRMLAILDEATPSFYENDRLKVLDYTDWTIRRCNESRLRQAADVPEEMREALGNEELQARIAALRKAIDDYRKAVEGLADGEDADQPEE